MCKRIVFLLAVNPHLFNKRAASWKDACSLAKNTLSLAPID